MTNMSIRSESQPLSDSGRDAFRAGAYADDQDSRCDKLSHLTTNTAGDLQWQRSRCSRMDPISSKVTM
jgi:hypothetical protein